MARVYVYKWRELKWYFSPTIIKLFCINTEDTDPGNLNISLIYIIVIYFLCKNAFFKYIDKFQFFTFKILF